MPNLVYHPELVGNLHDEHQKLYRQAEMLLRLAKKGDYKLVSLLLKMFKSALLAHVHEENLKLYVYLQNKLVKHSQPYMQMRALRKEMDGILIVLLDFFQNYEYIARERELQTTFLGDFQNIVKALSKRISTEENSLYPMYLP